MLKAIEPKSKPDINDLHSLLHDVGLIATMIDAVASSNITKLINDHEAHVVLAVELIHERLERAIDLSSQIFAAK